MYEALDIDNFFLHSLPVIYEMNLLNLHNWTIFIKYKRKCYPVHFVNFFETKQGLRASPAALPKSDYLNVYLGSHPF